MSNPPQKSIPQAVISRYGYVLDKTTMTEDQLVDVRKDLTVEPFNAFLQDVSHRKTFNVFQENETKISVPRFYGMTKFGPPQVDKINTKEYPVQKMKYTGKLRPNQEIIVEKVLKGLKSGGGGILVAGCGSGKTNMFIYIACLLGLKTLIMTHKTFLKNQIIDRITSNTNQKKVGIIQQKKRDVDHPFVVGMIQTICKKRKPGNETDEIQTLRDMLSQFQLVIIDEVHHMAASGFSRAFTMMCPKYILGVSAESARNDGCYKVIHWFMGPILHFEEQKPNDQVIVRAFHFRSSDEKHTKVYMNKYLKTEDRTKMVTNLTSIKGRNKFIYQLIQHFFNDGKNVLFLSGRRDQVNYLKKKLDNDECTKENVGLYLGEMSQDELEISKTKQIILGTYDMAQEGLDIPTLNVVILGTPKSAIKQSVGRILRQEFYEEHPLVVDIVDDAEIFTKQFGKRLKYYEKQEYTIYHSYVADDEDLCDPKPVKGEIYHMYNDEKYFKSCMTDLSLQEKPKKPSKHEYVPMVTKAHRTQSLFVED